MTRCLHLLVSGKVQQVGFRAATRREALRLGVTGHARNLADGQVEVVMSGEEEAVTALAQWLDQHIGRLDIIVLLIGILSAIVDNVPLVAASMGMYDLKTYPTDHFLWEFLAYCAGTGGSILIIGSAAGVAAMGLEKIHFFWYVKKISGLALVGYLAGAATYVAQHALTH